MPVFVVLNGVQARGRDADEADEAVAGLGVDVVPARVVSRVLLARTLVLGGGRAAAVGGRPRGRFARVHTFMCAQVNRVGGK